MADVQTIACQKNRAHPCPAGHRGPAVETKSSRLCGQKGAIVPVFQCNVLARNVTIDPYESGQHEGCCKRCDVFWGPQIVYVTGIPRSGSTWAYNVVRIGLAEKHGWNAVDFGYGMDPKTLGKQAAVIKLHRWNPLCLKWAWKIIHSTRNYAEVFTSWKRMDPKMGGTEGSRDRIADNDEQWTKHADYKFEFETMMIDKAETAAAILESIGSPADPEKVAATVDNLKSPATGVDPITLLMPNHRNPNRAQIA